MSEIVGGARGTRAPATGRTLPRRRRAQRRRRSPLGTGTLLVTWMLFGGLGALWLANWRLDIVTTASMDPTVPKDALAIIAPIDPRSLLEGDVISYTDPTNNTRIVLHRVIAIVDQGAGGRFFQTQGDANQTPDPVLVGSRSIDGKLVWSVPRLGTIARLLRTPLGPVLFVGVPLVSILRRRRRDAAPALEPVTFDIVPGLSADGAIIPPARGAGHPVRRAGWLARRVLVG